MAINADSRYIDATVVTEVGPDGETRQEMRVHPPRPQLIEYTYYRVVAGDRVDTIAHQFYGRGDYWWRIARANPEILDWLMIKPGDVIRVPNA